MNTAERALELAQANANNIEAALKGLAEVNKRLDRLTLDRAGFPGIDPNEPLVEAMRRELGGKARVRVVSLGELFAELERELEESPEVFEDRVERILREFAKGCGNGKPGDCEECLQGAVRAIVAVLPKK